MGARSHAAAVSFVGMVRGLGPREQNVSTDDTTPPIAPPAQMPGQQVPITQNEEMFRLLVESVRDYAIFMLDATGHVATWNTGAERIKGYRSDEIIGRHFSLFYPLSEAAAGKCELELEVAAREGRFEDEGWRVRKDGRQFWANVVISAARDRRGNLIGFSKVTRDLTERKLAEEERAGRLAAEQANRAKDEFLAVLGHELRNPLAPIVTALQLLKLRADGTLSKEHQVIERQVGHMVRLVEDLLDVSRIAKGKVTLKKQPVDLRDIVASAIEIASPLLDQRRHHVHVDAPPHGIVVEADEARLMQVFTNLVTNAAKYTSPGGHVRIGIRQEDGEAVIEVADDGIGIEPALLPRVFDLFVQGHQETDRAVGGLGIGLTLVRSLVDLHGGTVTAHSDGPGQGSTFTVRLPVRKIHARDALPRPGARRLAPTPCRILVVDDNEDALVLLGEALAAVGHEVRTAIDPVSALEVIKEWTPELAILDIGLPVMDGYELASRIRAELDGAPPKMFALTGYAQQDDRARIREAGFDAHFVKPVEVHRLLERMAADAGS
jgi:PAS domain S-box-containing protein